MSWFGRWRALALGVLCLVAPAGQADAQTQRERGPSRAELETLVEVSVLHGTHEQRAGDPRLSAMPELREGPFASYASYALLSRVRLPLTRARKRELRLPNGRLFQARLDEVLADGSSRLVASINRPDGKDFLPLLEVRCRPGQAFIVAGQSYKRGMLVLVIRVVR